MNRPKRATKPPAWKRGVGRVILLALLGGLHAAWGEVALAALFSDRAVLTASDSTAVWGKAAPGESVTITLADRTASARADDRGRWLARLDLTQLGPGPFELLVTGQNQIRVRDVLVGQVWLASGQSNMQFALRGDRDGDAAIAQSANPRVRHFKVALAASLDPLDNCRGEWLTAGPESAASFSAIGYYFAARLEAELGVPVGVIDATWGGTGIGGWLSHEAQLTLPELSERVERQLTEARAYPARLERYRADFPAWLRDTGRHDRPRQPEGPWQELKLPPGRGASVPGTPGAIWFRRIVEIPDGQAGRQGILVLGDIAGFDEVFWNGQRVGGTTPESLPGAPYARQYTIPGAWIGAGANELTIRVYSPDAVPTLLGRVLKLGPLSLHGDWQVRQEYTLPPAVSPAPVPPAAITHPQALPGAIFNGMIHPLLPYTIHGTIWYQGESNVARAGLYRTLFPLLIEDWRRHWQQPEMPFYFCQLANHGRKEEAPGDSLWAELREAQSQALALPHTGQAILIDLGEAANIHPWNKRDAAHRLARLALAKSYGRDLVWSGPVYASHAIEGDRIRLRFDHAAGGLVAQPLAPTYPVYLPRGETAPLARPHPDSQLDGFAVCGEDGKWAWAQATIDGESVVVWSPDVQAPVAVRYAWQNNPSVNLYNRESLPAAPFRTDAFPLRTDGLR